MPTKDDAWYEPALEDIRGPSAAAATARPAKHDSGSRLCDQQGRTDHDDAMPPSPTRLPAVREVEGEGACETLVRPAEPGPREDDEGAAKRTTEIALRCVQHPRSSFAAWTSARATRGSQTRSSVKSYALDAAAFDSPRRSSAAAVHMGDVSVMRMFAEPCASRDLVEQAELECRRDPGRRRSSAARRALADARICSAHRRGANRVLSAGGSGSPVTPC